ncbi:PAS domain-containing sensor histidine kinase [Melioribacter sp. OK-6-Me]|uniref:sensor histidine kinase n=1 Tax=unclassified Melioribacter TaxID=2627329 RepID=UPI003ED8DD66
MNTLNLHILSEIINAIDSEDDELILNSVINSLMQVDNAIKWIAIYLLNNRNYEFHLVASHPTNHNDLIETEYKLLIEDGTIAKILNANSLVYCSGESRFIRFSSSEEIYGFVIIRYDSENTIDEILLEFYTAVGKLISNWFKYNKRRKENLFKKNFVEYNQEHSKDLLEGIKNLRNILDSIQAGIVIINPETQEIVDANKMAEKLSGWKKDDIIGMRREELFLLNSWDYKEFGKLLGSESLLNKKDGDVLPILLTEQKIKLGNEQFILSTFSDITEQKNLEIELLEFKFNLEQKVEERTHELKKAYDKLKAEVDARTKLEKEKLKLYYAIYQSPVAMVIVDQEGFIEYVNPKFSELTGFYFDDVFGKKIVNVIVSDNDEYYIKEIAQMIRQEKIWKKDIRIKKRGGEFIWVSASVSGIVNDRGKLTHYLAVYEDISLKKKAEEEIIKAKEKAEEAARLKSSLLANMSHEFRTPLIGILGFTEFLLEDDLSQEAKEIIADINSAGKRLLNTLDSVLQLSELESLSEYLKLSKASLNELIRDTYEQYLPFAVSRGLQFKLNLPTISLVSEIDDDLFSKALAFIIDNAIKFTPKGEIEVSAENVNHNEKYWNAIKISDTGIGIDEKDFELIFQEFRQGSEGHKRNYEGTGLGLTLAKKMIEFMNGYISIESVKGKGSIFTIYIPAVDEN